MPHEQRKLSPHIMEGGDSEKEAEELEKNKKILIDTFDIFFKAGTNEGANRRSISDGSSWLLDEERNEFECELVLLKEKILQDAQHIEIQPSDQNNKQFKFKVIVTFPYIVAEFDYNKDFVNVDLDGKMQFLAGDNGLYLSLVKGEYRPSMGFARRSKTYYEDSGRMNQKIKEQKEDAEEFIRYITDAYPLYDDCVARFKKLSPESNAEIMLDREKLYHALIERYAKLTKEVVERTKKGEVMHRALDELKKYSPGIMLKEILLALPIEVRKVDEIREMTQIELATEIEKEMADFQAFDAKRYNLHRCMEFFAYQYFYGRSKMVVRWDIEREIGLQNGEQICIEGNVYCEPNEKGTYIIKFGDGDAETSVHWESDDPASTEDCEYHSKLGEKRDFYKDLDFVAWMSDELKRKYPLIKFENDFFETGSFHEKFRSFYFVINATSVAQEAERKGAKDARVMLNQILDIIRELIKKELNKK